MYVLVVSCYQQTFPYYINFTILINKNQYHTKNNHPKCDYFKSSHLIKNSYNILGDKYEKMVYRKNNMVDFCMCISSITILPILNSILHTNKI